LSLNLETNLLLYINYLQTYGESSYKNRFLFSVVDDIIPGCSYFLPPFLVAVAGVDAIFYENSAFFT
jgi:hypothetical protein